MEVPHKENLHNALMALIRSYPRSLTWYGGEIGVAPMTLKSFLINKRADFCTLVKIENYIEVRLKDGRIT